MAINTEILIQSYVIQCKNGKNINEVPLVFREEVLKRLAL